MSPFEIQQLFQAEYTKNPYNLFWVKAEDVNKGKYEGVASLYNGYTGILLPRPVMSAQIFNSEIAFKTNTFYATIQNLNNVEIRELTLEEEAEFLGKQLSSLSRFKLNELNVLFWDGKGNRTGPLLSFTRFQNKLTPPGKAYTPISLDFKTIQTFGAPSINAGGIPGDCGAYVMTGFNSVRTQGVRPPILQSAILAEFLFRLEYTLAGGGYVLCSCSDWNFPQTLKGYSINRVVNLIGKYSSGHVYSNNMNHGIFPMNKPGEKGHFRNEKGRNHWVNIMTFDGLRQFYEGPEFQEEILPTFYDWWGLQELAPPPTIKPATRIFDLPY